MKVKRKGVFEYENLPHHKDQSMLIVPMAVSKFLVESIPVEETIRNHKDRFDFMLRTKVPRSSKLVLRDALGEEITLQNVCRFYASTDGSAGQLVKIMPPKKGGEATEDKDLSVFAGVNMKPCNNMKDFKWDINYDFYIDEANKLIEFFK